MKTTAFIALSGLLILCHQLQADTLNIRSLALGGEETIPERYVKVDDGYKLLSFSAMQPSEVVKAQIIETTLPLFELKKNPSGEDAYAVVEKIKFPAGAKGVLLLGWGTPDGTRYLAINDDYLSSKYNDWLIINTSKKPIAFYIGRENKPIAIKSNSVVNHRINAPEGVGVDVVAQSKWGDKVKTFYSTYWPIRAKERGIVIFYESGERIALRKITDVLFKEEEAKKINDPNQVVRSELAP